MREAAPPPRRFRIIRTPFGWRPCRAADRKKASDGKERVLASMGLNSGGASGASWQASAQSGSSSSGVSGFFTGVFSGAENTPPPPRPAEEAPRPVSAPVSSASAASTQSGSSSSGVWGFFSGVFSGAENTAAAAPSGGSSAEHRTRGAGACPARVCDGAAAKNSLPGASQANEGRACQASPGGLIGIGATGVRFIGGVRRRRGPDRIQRCEQRSVRPFDRQKYQGSAVGYSHQSPTRRHAERQRRLPSPGWPVQVEKFGACSLLRHATTRRSVQGYALSASNRGRAPFAER